MVRCVIGCLIRGVIDWEMVIVEASPALVTARVGQIPQLDLRDGDAHFVPI